MSTQSRAKPYMNPYLAGTLLGIVLFLAYLITGTGLGASGGLNRLLVYVQNIVTYNKYYLINVKPVRLV